MWVPETGGIYSMNRNYFISYMLSSGGVGRCSVEADDFLRIGDLEVQLEKLTGEGVTVIFYKKISTNEAKYLDRPDQTIRRVKVEANEKEH
jgi:hypothetical protein